MELYIIRHAQSTNNISMIYNPEEREADPPLTELGLKQAQALGEYLKREPSPETWIDHPVQWKERGESWGITQLYCSPMQRTLQTCQPVAEALRLDPQVWIDLHEHGGIHHNSGDGRGEVGQPGLTRGAIEAAFPGYRLPAGVTEHGWYRAEQGMEDLATCQGRAIRVAEVLRHQADSHERIALVTHGMFINCLLKALLNMLPNDHLYFVHYNTAITRVDFYPDETIGLRFVNRVSHLPLELLS